MTLDEAIKHAEEVVEEHNKIKRIKGVTLEECKCAEEHRQLAEWLRGLKDYRKRKPSYEAGYNDAKREIALSGEYERAYERGKSDAEQTRWIPVSERLPEENGYYLTTTMHHEVYCDYWEEDQFNRTEAVIAWMPLPEPYKAYKEESEELCGMSQEELIEAFVKEYGELARVCGYTTEQIEKTEKVIRRKNGKEIKNDHIHQRSNHGHKRL